MSTKYISGVLSPTFNINPSGDFTTGTWKASTVTVPYGGTGATSFIAGQLLVGNSTGALQTYSGLVWNSVSNTLSSTNLSISGSSTLGTISSGTWNGSTIGVSYGGTGATSFTAGQLMIGNGTGALQTYSGLSWNTGTNTLSATNLSTGALAASGITNVSNTTTIGNGNTLSSSSGAFTTAGDIHLYGTSGMLAFSSSMGSGAPTFTTRSTGTRMLVYPALTSSTCDYAFGISTNAMWYSVPDTAKTHRFYCGTTDVFDITGTGITAAGTGTFGGVLTVNSTTASSSTTTGSGTFAGGIGVAGTVYANAVNSVSSVLGTVTSGTWNGTTIGVPYGGTGATSFTAGQILVGNSTSALQSYSGLTWNSGTNTLTATNLSTNSLTSTGSTINGGSQSIVSSTNDGFANQMSFTKSRAGTTTLAGDELGYISFYGYDTANTGKRAGYVYFKSGTAGSGFVPGQIDLHVTNASGTDITALHLDGSTLTSPNSVSFSNATASSSTTTGALVVTGGAGFGGSGYFGGLLSTAGGLQAIGNQTGTPPSTAGAWFTVKTATYTDSATATSGTLSNFYSNYLASSVLAASNTGITTTNASTLYIAGAPTAGTNETITNAYALNVGSGLSYLQGGLTVYHGGNLCIQTGATQVLTQHLGSTVDGGSDLGFGGARWRNFYITGTAALGLAANVISTAATPLLSVTSSNTTQCSGLEITNSSQTNAQFQLVAGGSAATTGSGFGPGWFGIFGTNSNSWNWSIDSSGSVYLPNSGSKLGIGFSSHTPFAPLQIGSADGDKIVFAENGGAAGSKISHLSGWGLGYYAGQSTDVNGGYHSFYTGSSGPGYLERFRIDGTANNRITANLPITVNSTAITFSGTAIGASSFLVNPGNATDIVSTTGTNTNIQRFHHLGGGQSISASNTGVVYSNATTLYIGSPPVAGTNVSLSNSYSLYANGPGYFVNTLTIPAADPALRFGGYWYESGTSSNWTLNKADGSGAWVYTPFSVDYTTGSVTSNGIFKASNGTASTSTTTGAAVVTGGLGVSGAVYTGGALHVTDTTTSSSTTTGSGIFGGGLGVAGNAYFGGTVNAAGFSITGGSPTFSNTGTSYLFSVNDTNGADNSKMQFYLSPNSASSTSVAQLNFEWYSNEMSIRGVRAGDSSFQSMDWYSNTTKLMSLIASSGNLSLTSTTDAISTVSASLTTAGGLGIGKTLCLGYGRCSYSGDSGATNGWYRIGLFTAGGNGSSRAIIDVIGNAGYNNNTSPVTQGGSTKITVSINANQSASVATGGAYFYSTGDSPCITAVKLVQNGSNRSSYYIHANFAQFSLHTMDVVYRVGDSFVPEFTYTGVDPGANSSTVQAATNSFTVQNPVGIGLKSPTGFLHVTPTGDPSRASGQGSWANLSAFGTSTYAVGLGYSNTDNNGVLACMSPGVAAANMTYVAQAHTFYCAGTPYMTLNSSGQLSLSASTAATSTTTGALTVAGGLGVAGSGYFADLHVDNGSWTSNGNDVFINASGGNAITFRPTTGSSTNQVVISGGGVLSVSATTTSTSASTGAFTVAGGAGITGDIYTNGVVNTNAGTGGTFHWRLRNAGSQRWGIGLNGSESGSNNGSDLAFWGYSDDTLTNTAFLSIKRSTGDLNVWSGTASSSTTTGALQVAGGIGVVKNSVFGGTLAVTGQCNFNSTTASTSTTTGGGVFAGGIGVAGNSVFGGTFAVTGQCNFNSTTASTSTSTGGGVFAGGIGVAGNSVFGGTLAVTGQTNINSATNSSSTTTGALVVSGGIGLGGQIISGGTACFPRLLTMYDNRTSNPAQFTNYTTAIGFGSWGNNGNVGNYADQIMFNTYTDGSGGNQNLVCFNKLGIGMRIFQGGFGSSSAFSTYYDTVMQDSSGNISTNGSSVISAATVKATGSTASTNTTTGAAIVTGGLGVGGDTNVGGTIKSGGNTVLTTISGTPANYTPSSCGQSGVTFTVSGISGLAGPGVTAAYSQVGKLVFAQIYITYQGATGTPSGSFSCALPVSTSNSASPNSYTALATSSALGAIRVWASPNSGTLFIYQVSGNSQYNAQGTGDTIQISFVYPCA